MNIVTNFAAEAISICSFLLPIAVGGLATEYVGVLNIALEGLLLAGAFVFAAVGSHFGPVAGAMFSLVFCSILAWAVDLFTRKAKADPFVTGLALNLFSVGASSMAAQTVFGTRGVVGLPSLVSGRPLMLIAGNIPFLGPVFLVQRSVSFFAFFACILILLFLSATPFGLRARAAGMSSGAIRIAGLDPGRVRGAAFAMSGFGCAVAGIALVSSIGAWVPNMSAGRGWIALAAMYMGAKRPLGTLAATAVFALFFAGANVAQIFPNVPAELASAMPFAITAIIVLLGSGKAVKSSTGKL